MDEVPDLRSLRGEQIASDAEYIEQLEQLSLGQEREAQRLRAVVDGDDRLWAHVVMQIMLTIDGGHRTWGDPLAGQVISAVADLETERERLRAVVDATLVWQRQMTDLACAVDVLHVADLYRIVTAQLDESANGEDT
jgi:hypothetical protein